MRAGFERAALVLGTPIVAILVAGCSLLAAQSPPPPAEQPPDRPFDRDGVLAVVNAYQAAHPDAIGGVFLNDAGVVTVLLVGDATVHEAAIRARLAPKVTIAFRIAMWSEADLRKLQDEVAKESDWFASIDARAEAISVDTINNVLVVKVSSANPRAAALIVDHFGAAGRMRVESDGTGVLLEPQGHLSGRVADKARKPIRGADIEYTPLFDAGAIAGVGHVTGPDGRFDIGQVPPGRWRVEVWENGAPIASAEVDVPSGGRAEAVIVMNRPPETP